MELNIEHVKEHGYYWEMVNKALQFHIESDAYFASEKEAIDNWLLVKDSLWTNLNLGR